jgi:hypothetical protein
MDRSPAMIGDDTLLEAPAAKCPSTTAARHLPVGFDGEPRPAPQRSRADLMMRSLLRIHERPAGLTSGDAYSAFQKSMLLSAVRCTLPYVVFPFVLPTVGLATGVGPVIGIVIGVFAMVCDVFSIRRFFAVDHRWRWHFTIVALSVISLLWVLLIRDIAHLLS